MYPLLILAATLVLWLYLRILYRQRVPALRDYAALAAASYLLANVHALSALYFAALGAYHLLLAPKGGRWLRTSLAIGLALVLFSPWIAVLLDGGIARSFVFWDEGGSPAWRTIEGWLAVSFNESLLLVLLTLAGIITACRRTTRQCQPYFFLFVFFALILWLAAQFTSSLHIGVIRVTLSGLPFVLLFVSAGFYALYRLRFWLGCLVLLWIVAGLVSQQTGNWNDYLVGRAYPFHLPPWQAISRVVRQSDFDAPIVGYRFDSLHLFWPARVDYPQHIHYFENHDLRVEPLTELVDFQDYLRNQAITEPVIWLFYQSSIVADAEAEQLDAAMTEASYRLCDTRHLGIDTTLARFGWATLACQPAQLLATSDSELLTYEFYGSIVERDENRLLFVDRWGARADFPHDNFALSIQLLSEDWSNEAQVDLPLAHEGELRQFSIDLSKVPAGNYRLMAILYDKHTGEKSSWLANPGPVPSLLTLAEIELTK